MKKLFLVTVILFLGILAQAQQDTSIVINRVYLTKLIFKDKNRPPVKGALFSINDSLVYVSDMIRNNNYYDDIYAYQRYPIQDIESIGIRGRGSRLKGLLMGLVGGSVLGTTVGFAVQKKQNYGAPFIGMLTGMGVGMISGYTLGERYRKKHTKEGINIDLLNRRALVGNDFFDGQFRPVFRKRRMRVGAFLNTPLTISESDNHEEEDALAPFYGVKYMVPFRKRSYLALSVSRNGVRQYADFMGSILLYSKPGPVQLMLEPGVVVSANTLFGWADLTFKAGVGAQFNYGKFHTYLLPNIASHDFGLEGSVEIGAFYDLF